MGSQNNFSFTGFSSFSTWSSTSTGKNTIANPGSLIILLHTPRPTIRGLSGSVPQQFPYQEYFTLLSKKAPQLPPSLSILSQPYWTA
jgi:hypothetical protein